jgi:hypothetical protein
MSIQLIFYRYSEIRLECWLTGHCDGKNGVALVPADASLEDDSHRAGDGHRSKKRRPAGSDLILDIVVS